MKLITKAHVSQRRLIEILRVIEEIDKPVGARAISDLLSNRGYDLGERAVRYNLKILDELGFTKKLGYSGRVLTPLGTREVNDALVDDRIGFVNTRIEEYMFRTSFDPISRRGEVVANTSIIDKANAEEIFDILADVFDAGYSINKRILLLDEGSEISNLKIPAGSLGIATVCSITLDGILMKKGIPVLTSYAGLVEINEGQPNEFTDLIAYAGSSLDPIKIFMARRVTRVANVISEGSGCVLANVREVPIAADEMVHKILNECMNAGFGGLLRIGNAGEQILGCPIGPGKMGIALYAGVNGLVAAEELDIKVTTEPISMILDYSRFTDKI